MNTGTVIILLAVLLLICKEYLHAYLWLRAVLQSEAMLPLPNLFVLFLKALAQQSNVIQNDV